LLVPLGDLLDDPAAERQGLRGVLQGYVRSLSSERRYLLGRYHVVDMARKVVGVGSVGTRCWIVLLLGGTTTTRCCCRPRRRRSPCSPPTRAVSRASTRAAGWWPGSG